VLSNPLQPPTVQYNADINRSHYSTKLLSLCGTRWVIGEIK
jgi:hypothetical protein